MASRENNSLTDAQQRAVAARGNVLVMAGAGTGKTHTLVARCLNLICDEEVQLSEILIVTFTEAAAAEMKHRLRVALEKESRENFNEHLGEQIALFDAAHIGTLHGFCFKLVREHFHELGLDPQIFILDEGQTRLLADETLEEIFNSHYENEDEFSLAVQELIKIYGNSRDEKIRASVLRLHNYISTRADSESWLVRQIETFSSDAPVQWREWLAEAISDWKIEWLPVLEHLRLENPKAAECLGIFEKSDSAELLQKILATDGKDNFPKGKFTKLREPLKNFFDEAGFLNSFTTTDKSEPLAEDWSWIQNHMRTFLQLAKEFSEKFSARKRSDGVLDFHDLEQFSLKLLWDFENEKPTEAARNWRKKLRFVFVDEYQDINAAQDKIISAISGEGKNANRFLVGDVKQSIYRFRLADPKIFRDYAKQWPTIPLAENFRSRESVLSFVNSVFETLMREEIGGVNYDDEAKLIPTRVDVRPTDEAKAQLLLRISKKQNDDSENDEIADLEESEKEARMLALRLRELKKSGHDWRDMVVLLRSPRGKAEIFAKQFEQTGIPLHVERGGFYDSSEILDLLSLLQLLDNPLQDVPLIAVLRSPLVGCSLDELAEIRLLQRDGKFWFALNQVQSPKSKVQNELRTKSEKFLERFQCWRKIAKQVSLSQCLEEILAETHYSDWLKSRPRGAQRLANVQSFLNLAEKFDQFQRQGLFRFLKFVEAQREIEAEPEVAPVAEENAVRLMSIHQSKGLEFPVVALADLGKRFNEQDLRLEIILDERFGLCPRVKPPNAGGRYPSFGYWLAQKNQRRELRGEELRLLYVALTRARDKLVLCGSISERKWENFFEKDGETRERGIVSARSFLDWLGLWAAQNADVGKELPQLDWRIFGDEELVVEKEGNGKQKIGELILSEEKKSKIRTIAGWKYKFEEATRLKAKSSVTALRREAVDLDEEAEQIFDVRFSNKKLARTLAPSKSGLSAVDAGRSAHKFLEHFDFGAATDLKSLEAEAARLENENYLSTDERNVLDLKSILEFWNSEVGNKILSQKNFIKRELPFTAKFSPDELSEILGRNTVLDLEDEFVVVQGVADLVVILPREIWIVDFKTDGVSANEIKEKTKFYAPQLKLYANALSKIYSRPTTNCWLHFLTAQKTVQL